MMIKNADEALFSRVKEIERLVKEFKETFENGTEDTDHFMTINEIEEKWSQLRNDTDHLYSDMVAELMSGIDEKELIHKKKLNTKEKV